MKLIINIPEEEYKALVINQYWGSKSDLENIIVNGVPLPKGHGRLIDADALIDEIPIDLCDGYEAIDVIERASPIIEADKEVNDEGDSN